MSDNTKIEWTDASWQVTHGCKKIAPGCANCYAIRDVHRMAGNPNPKISEPRQGLTHRVGDILDWTGKCVPAPQNLDWPLRKRKPLRIFVNSNSDLFHDDVPFEYIAAVFGVMAACPQHTFQVLTKRPERALEFFEWLAFAKNCAGDDIDPQTVCADAAITTRRHNHFDWSVADGARWPLPNVEFGVSLSDQGTADKNIPILLRIPAAVRFVSAEPLLGPVDLSGHLWITCRDCGGKGFVGPHGSACICAKYSPRPGYERRNELHWVIVGGESGPGARPCDVAWIRSIVQQCKAASVPVFVKQVGSRSEVNFYDECRDEWEELHDGVWPEPYVWINKPFQPHIDEMVHLKTRDPKGGDPSEWPADLRIRQFPQTSST